MADPPLVEPTRPLRIFIIAGEPSGDLLGGRLMAALKLRTFGQISFTGVGGERMKEQGLRSLFPMEELSVMGVVELLPRARQLLRRVRETVAQAQTERPDAVVSIDSPAFAFRIGKRLKGTGIPLIHYVAPQVWAWRPGRSRVIARFLDHLLTLLPFEPRWFEGQGLATTFVGHPVVEGGAGQGDGARFRAEQGISPETPLLCALPGSRRGEVGRHLPIFGDAFGLLGARLPGLRVVVPTVDAIAGLVEAACSAWPVPALVVRGESQKFDAMAAADGALAASGTVTLELALAKLPAVVAYRVNPVSAALARRLLKVRYVTLVNIILDRPVIPEFLQENCVPEKLAAALEQVMTDPRMRALQGEAAETVAVMLGRGGEPPSFRAADAVLRAIELGPRRGPRPARAGLQKEQA